MLAIGREGVNETALFHVEQCGKRQNIRAGPVTCGSGVLSARHPAVLREAARGGSPAPAATPPPPATSAHLRKYRRVAPNGTLAERKAAHLSPRGCDREAA